MSSQSLATVSGHEREQLSQLQTRLLTSPAESITIDVYKQLMVHYLFLSKINEGKFLWENLPNAMKSDKEFQFLAMLVSLLNQKQYAEFYRLGQTAFENPSSHQLSPTIVENLRQLISRVTMENVRLIELAYKSISFDDLQKTFGLNRTSVEQLCLERHWQQDPDGIHLLPHRNDLPSSTSNSNLAKLVELVCFLERSTSLSLARHFDRFHSEKKRIFLIKRKQTKWMCLCLVGELNEMCCWKGNCSVDKG